LVVLSPPSKKNCLRTTVRGMQAMLVCPTWSSPAAWTLLVCSPKMMRSEIAQARAWRATRPGSCRPARPPRQARPTHNNNSITHTPRESHAHPDGPDRLLHAVVTHEPHIFLEGSGHHPELSVQNPTPVPLPSHSLLSVRKKLTCARPVCCPSFRSATFEPRLAGRAETHRSLSEWQPGESPRYLLLACVS